MCSGVRNSWLTLLKNAVLARSISASASARCRSCSYARALASPIAICSAIRRTNWRYVSSNARPGWIPRTKNPAASLCSRNRIGTTAAFSGGTGQLVLGSTDARCPRSTTRPFPGQCRIESPEILPRAVDDRRIQRRRVRRWGLPDTLYVQWGDTRKGMRTGWSGDVRRACLR